MLLPAVGFLPVARVPVDPTVEQAQTWLRQELAKPQYSDDRSLLQRVVDWFWDLLDRVMGTSIGGLPGWALPVVLALVALLVGAVLWAKVRREPGARTRTGTVLDEPHLDAEAYRRRARAAEARGDLDSATTDWFRAIAASAAERTLLDDAPGRTAHEVSVALAATFPAEGRELARAADEFDAIRYGNGHVDVTVAHSIAQLDARLAQARPLLAHSGAAGGTGGTGA